MLVVVKAAGPIVGYRSVCGLGSVRLNSTLPHEGRQCIELPNVERRLAEVCPSVVGSEYVSKCCAL